MFRSCRLEEKYSNSYILKREEGWKHSVYSKITLVVPNYEAAPRLFYSEYFWQRYMTCDSAAHQEFPMGKILPEILNLCEVRKEPAESSTQPVFRHMEVS